MNPDYAIRCQHCNFLIQGAHLGDYEIVSYIGSGSFGDVYRAREPAPLSRMFALKILRPGMSSETDLKTFKEEAQRIANLQHEYILPVYGFGQLESEQPYFVMELATGTL